MCSVEEYIQKLMANNELADMLLANHGAITKILSHPKCEVSISLFFFEFRGGGTKKAVLKLFICHKIDLISWSERQIYSFILIFFRSLHS